MVRRVDHAKLLGSQEIGFAFYKRIDSAFLGKEV